MNVVCHNNVIRGYKITTRKRATNNNHKTTTNKPPWGTTGFDVLLILGLPAITKPFFFSFLFSSFFFSFLFSSFFFSGRVLCDENKNNLVSVVCA